ncbi:MAG: hypothetical protein RIQ60_3712 [Pseudomonadota bacterium]|jgi:hypothetical protein
MSSDSSILLFFLGALAGGCAIGYLRGFKIAELTSSLRYAIQKNNEISRSNMQLEDHARELTEEKASIEKQKQAQFDIFNETIARLKQESALLPSVVKWANRVQEAIDEQIARDLTEKARPALKAAEAVREARELARNNKAEAETLRNHLALYEAQAPWLAELVDCSLTDILEGLAQAQAMKDAGANGRDPASLFLTRAEWSALSPSKRNQLALDRYWDYRQRNAWLAGIQYERYIGYCYEQEGFSVEYHGAIEGVEDLGIDLICTKGDVIQVVQCKRLSLAKQLPVRENAVAQIYGAALYYAISNQIDRSNVKPVLITTFELSPRAREFASALGVYTRENKSIERYPCIKCNFSSSGERIYHLPFDQQYDKTRIGKGSKDFYAMDIDYAEKMGFRRAYRWSGT